MSIFNLVELLRSGNSFIWTFCNLIPRIFKVFWFNKNETTIINNTVMISKSEIFSAELIKSHGVSPNGTFTVNRSWNKWFYYTPKPIRLRNHGWFQNTIVTDSTGDLAGKLLWLIWIAEHIHHWARWSLLCLDDWHYRTPWCDQHSILWKRNHVYDHHW